jgi:hypothetical protein
VLEGQAVVIVFWMLQAVDIVITFENPLSFDAVLMLV